MLVMIAPNHYSCLVQTETGSDNNYYIFYIIYLQ